MLDTFEFTEIEDLRYKYEIIEDDDGNLIYVLFDQDKDIINSNMGWD